MKKIIKIFILILLIILLMILYMVRNDNNYYKKMNKIINNKLDIKSDYINYYDGYYIVTDNKYLYLISNEYKIILNMDINLIHENSKNYDIIYKDEKIMYFSDKYIKDKLVYKYYDLYSYEEIDSVMVGGNDG